MHAALLLLKRPVVQDFTWVCRLPRGAFLAGGEGNVGLGYLSAAQWGSPYLILNATQGVAMLVLQVEQVE